MTLLKDTIHLYLLQQSEYLRRLGLGLALSSQPSITEERGIEKSIDTALSKLGHVLEYQEAMGVTTEIADSKVGDSTQI